MSYHNHPPTELDRVGLVADCPRCEQLADDPRQISPPLLREIFYRFETHDEWRTHINVRVVDHLEKSWVLARSMEWHSLSGFRELSPNMAAHA